MTTETTNIEMTASIIEKLSPVGKAVIKQLTSTEIVGTEDYLQVTRRTNDLMDMFVISLECFGLGSTNLKQITSSYVKFKCSHRDLGSAMNGDFTEVEYANLRAIRVSVWANAQKVLREIVITMKQYQDGAIAEAAEKVSLHIWDER